MRELSWCKGRFLLGIHSSTSLQGWTEVTRGDRMKLFLTHEDHKASPSHPPGQGRTADKMEIRRLAQPTWQTQAEKHFQSLGREKLTFSCNGTLQDWDSQITVLSVPEKKFYWSFGFVRKSAFNPRTSLWNAFYQHHPRVRKLLYLPLFATCSLNTT